MSVHEKHQVQETSLESYFEIPDLGKRQLEVLRAFAEHGPGTDFEIAVAMNREKDEYFYPNKVRPRRNELCDMGLLRESDRRECGVSGKTAIVWETVRHAPRFLEARL